MTTPLTVSVITVCRNAQATIDTAIQSVLAQDYPHIEYIIVDGKSSDGTMAMVNRYRSRITRVISEEDHGIYDAMNKAVAFASGDIVYFLNADDYLYDAQVVGAVVDEFKQDDGLGILCGKIVYMNVPKGACIRTNFEFKTKQQLLGESLPQQVYFIRRKLFETVGFFDRRYVVVADFDWLLRALDQGTKLRSCDRIFAYFNAQGYSYQLRYQTIVEKIRTVFIHSNALEFIAYAFIASARQVRGIISDLRHGRFLNI